MSEGGMMLQDKVQKIRELLEGKDDPAYAPLLRVVRKKAWGQLITNKYGAAVGMEEGGYTTRSWEGALDGEMEGALIKALHKTKGCPTELSIFARDKIYVLLWQQGDTREAACDAVLEALKG